MPVTKFLAVSYDNQVDKAQIFQRQSRLKLKGALVYWALILKRAGVHKVHLLNPFHNKRSSGQ